MTTKLLPCPICNATPCSTKNYDIVCYGRHGTPIIIGKTNEHARKLWNAWVEGYKKGEVEQAEERKEEESCENCKFRRGDTCKRYPFVFSENSVIELRYIRWEYPKGTMNWDWCGEWKKREGVE